MSDLLLYSTNVYLKLVIQQNYQGDVHYVWCSEHFDSGKASPYTIGSNVPPSSNPADIYRQLQADAQRRDLHSPKIIAQRSSFISLAHQWAANGEIDGTQKNDIIHMAENADFSYWRPLLYIVPRATLEPTRIKLVPVAQRAGFGDEFIVADLKGSEFDVIEL